MRPQDRHDALLILRINIPKDDGLGGTNDRMDIVLIHQRTQSTLETKVPLILHAAIINMLSIKQLPIALFPPSHPIIILPLRNRTPRCDFLPVITLHELRKLLHSQSVDQILHTCIRPYVAITVITLCSHNSLQYLHNILLRYESHMIGSTGKGVLLVVRASHATPHHNIEPLEFTSSIIANNHDTNIIRVQIQRIIAWHRNTNLEFTWQVLCSIYGFDGIVQNNPPSAIVQHGFIDIIMFHLLSPGLDRGGFLSIEPNF